MDFARGGGGGGEGRGGEGGEWSRKYDNLLSVVQIPLLNNKNI